MSRDTDASATSVPGRPISIKVHDHDNVAIVANAAGLKTGLQLDDGTVLLQDVPQGHQVAATDINESEPIIRYGAVRCNLRQA